MNRRDSLEGYACFRKFKDDMTASTVAEGEELVGVNRRYREQSVQRYAANGSHPFSVGQQRQGSSQHCFRPAKKGLSAMKVHGERDIAVRGEIISAAPLVVIKTNAVVSDEDCRPTISAEGPC